MEFLRKGFKTIGFKGDFQLGLVDEQHILIRFELTDDYHRCWLHGTWNFKSYQMRMLKWTPTFHVDEEPPVAPIWVTLEHLPLFMFAKEPMFSIGNLIGKPLKIDSATENLTRPSVARICVEIDLLKPLLKRFWFGQGDRGYWQSIKYETIPSYCSTCKRFGHTNIDCELDTHLGQSQPKPVTKQYWKVATQLSNKEHPDPSTKDILPGQTSTSQVRQKIDDELNKIVEISDNVLKENLHNAAVDNVVVDNVPVENSLKVMGDKQLAQFSEDETNSKCPQSVCQIVKEKATEQSSLENEDHYDAINKKAECVESDSANAKGLVENAVEEGLAEEAQPCESLFNVQEIMAVQIDCLDGTSHTAPAHVVEELFKTVPKIDNQLVDKDSGTEIQPLEAVTNHVPSAVMEKEKNFQEGKSTSESSQKATTLNPNATEFHFQNEAVNKTPKVVNPAEPPNISDFYIELNPNVSLSGTSPTLSATSATLIENLTMNQLVAISEEVKNSVYQEGYQGSHDFQYEDEEWSDEEEEDYLEKAFIRDDSYLDRKRGRPLGSRKKILSEPHAMRRRSSKSLD